MAKRTRSSDRAILGPTTKRTTAGRAIQTTTRRQLIDALGRDVMRFQDGSTDFDDLAAQILALERRDLPVLTMLLFGGAVPIAAVAAAQHGGRSAVVATLDRLELAGYARRRTINGQPHVEITDHARQWIRNLWEPLQQEGQALLERHSTRELASMHAFLTRASEMQERHLRRLRAWVTVPSARATRSHLRGGLAPAALQRVQLFVEANLDQNIRLQDLAVRAGLSHYHFARAFRVATGMTPRTFIEERRIERARQLLAQSSGSIADVAVRAGFGSQSRLTTTFRNRTGFTPAQYRRARR